MVRLRDLASIGAVQHFGRGSSLCRNDRTVGICIRYGTPVNVGQTTVRIDDTHVPCANVRQKAVRNSMSVDLGSDPGAKAGPPHIAVLVSKATNLRDCLARCTYVGVAHFLVLKVNPEQIDTRCKNMGCRSNPLLCNTSGRFSLTSFHSILTRPWGPAHGTHRTLRTDQTKCKEIPS